jgi:ABC-2 type transport system ATP-binding protein
MAENMIEIKNLYKKYKNSDEFSVNDISLNIDKNEIYGILGPNGAGKTTLISMLSGLIKPTSGQFTINGLSPQKDGLKSGRSWELFLRNMPLSYLTAKKTDVFRKLVWFKA